MNVRKILASTAAAAMIAGVVTIASAPAASAATINLTADCSSTAPPIQSVTQIVADAGDTIVIAGGADCLLALGLDPAVVSPNRPTADPAGTFTFVLAGDLAPGNYGGNYEGGNIIDVNNDPDGGPRCNASATFDNVCGGQWYVTIRGAATDAAAPIPAWVQGYGRASADEVCLEGWNASWAEWMNDGTGGFVCERSIPSLG